MTWIPCTCAGLSAALLETWTCLKRKLTSMQHFVKCRLPLTKMRVCVCAAFSYCWCSYSYGCYSLTFAIVLLPNVNDDVAGIVSVSTQHIIVIIITITIVWQWTQLKIIIKTFVGQHKATRAFAWTYPPSNFWFTFCRPQRGEVQVVTYLYELQVVTYLYKHGFQSWCEPSAVSS